jgi:orotidine-5'-phosphate decarboxylase
VAVRDKLATAWERSGSMLCVGLDPDPSKMPAPLAGAPDAIFEFCRAIVDATADVVCAVKPQVAHFAAHRAEAQLERLCHYVRETYPDVVLVVDAKRGDIGSTAAHYATEVYDRYAADIATVNPYLGADAVTPFLERGAAFILCRTSNPGARDLQDLDVGGRPLYLHVAALVADEWSKIGECGLVVGATYPEEMGAIRDVAGDLPFLVPGVGAQGGDIEGTVRRGSTGPGTGLVISSSRAILHASLGDDFADAARAEAIRTRDAINAATAAAPH